MFTLTDNLFYSVLITTFGMFLSVDIECHFNTSTVWYNYPCEVTNDVIINSQETTTVNRVIGTHGQGKSHNDVKQFNAEDKIIEYFPKGLEYFFPNIKVLSIMSCGLKEIHQSDLEMFPELRWASFYDNNIQVLEKGLFSKNPKLGYIFFNRNKIIFIHDEVFKNLPKLTHIGLGNNECINGYYDSSDFQDLFRTISTNCSAQN